MQIDNLWYLQSLYGLIFFILFFGFYIYKRYDLLPAILFCYILISALFIFQNPEIKFGKFQTNFDTAAARAFISAFTIITVLSTLTTQTAKCFLVALELLSLFNATLVLSYGYGLFNNPSMDGCFIALMYMSLNFRPELYKQMKNGKIKASFIEFIYMLFCGILPVLAIIQIRQITPIAILVTSLFFYWRKFLFVLFLIYGVTAYQMFFTNSGFFSSNGRFAVWKDMLKWWYEHVDMWIGLGTGSFEWAAPLIQNQPKAIFIWMHNEYLQILFEQGITGLLLSLCLIVFCLFKSFKRPWLFSTIIGLLVCFCTQFPLRFFITQVFIVLLIRITLTNEDEIWLKY